MSPARRPRIATDVRPVAMTAVVIADVGGRPAARPLVHGLARGLRRIGGEVAAHVLSEADTPGAARVATALRRALRSGAGPPTLALFGDEARQRRLMWGLALAGLLPRVRLAVHAGAARIPYDPALADLFARAHIVVTESEVAARAVRRCCAEAGEQNPDVVATSPMLPTLPTGGPTDGRARRRARMGMNGDALVIGCWVDDEMGQDGWLAMRIFQQFVRGHYWQCGDCGHLTSWSLDDHLRPVRSEQCQRCRSRSGSVGAVRDDTHLVLVGEPGSGTRAWSPSAIGEHLGLGGRVVHETERAAADVARLWGGVDIHLQPHLLADVPASLRTSCVLGVPMVATRYGAVEEQFDGVARLVPPRAVLEHSSGHRIALMDPGGALVELCRLADDREARRLTGNDVRELARQWEVETALDRWTELLGTAIAN